MALVPWLKKAGTLKVFLQKTLPRQGIYREREKITWVENL